MVTLLQENKQLRKTITSLQERIVVLEDRLIELAVPVAEAELSQDQERERQTLEFLETRTKQRWYLRRCVRLLHALVRNPGKAFSHDYLLHIVAKNPDHVSTNLVPQFIAVTRRVLKDLGVVGAIENEFGFGYRLRADALEAVLNAVPTLR